MSHTTSIISAPVDVSDVAYILGSNSLDVGNLIKNEGTINQWAKYKPVRTSDIGLITRDVWQNMGFGDNVPNATTLNAFVTMANRADNGWIYQRPNAIYRLLDFAKITKVNNVPTISTDSGYNKNAINPFGTFSVASSFTIGGTFTGGNDHTWQLGDTNLAILDLSQAAWNTQGVMGINYYGIALVNQGSGNSYLFFNDSNIRNSERGYEPLTVPAITLTSSNIEDGNYKAYPFLISAAPPQGRTSKVTSKTATLTYPMIPVPGSTAIDVIVAGITFTITLNVTVSASQTTGYKNVLVTASVGASDNTTITDVYIKLRKSSNAYDDALETGEVATLKASSQAIYSDLQAQFTDSHEVLNTIDKAWIGFNCAGVQYTKSERILIPQ